VIDPTLAFVCPKCKGTLERSAGSLACIACPGRYQLVAGDIPIFLDPADRPASVPDPGIPFARALELADELQRTPGSFHDLVDAYYQSLCGTQQAELFEYYRRITKLRNVAPTSEEVTVAGHGLAALGMSLPRVRLALEFGCGWGFSLAALAVHRILAPALRGSRLCGFDLNPAILPIARRLFQELELPNISLAVADATRPLPFAERSIDLICSNGVVEHIPEQDRLMQNLDRALSADAVLQFLIPNRYMVHKEPHFGVRWVGFVPRHLQRRYVGYRLGLLPEHVETILSYAPGDLASLLSRNFPEDVLLAVPCIPSDPSRLRRVLCRTLGKLGVNRYHCVVRRSSRPLPPGATPGRLHVTSTYRGQPLRHTSIFPAAQRAA
jgi:SAM-dependent methyltransferase